MVELATESDMFEILTGRPPLTPERERGAVIDDTGDYRYALWRAWDANLPWLLWVMLNPSKADALKDDLTICKCVGFSKLWGYGGLYVVNLFALRSTDPKALYSAADPVGPRNDEYIREAADECEGAVCAWGAHGALRDRNAHVKYLVRQFVRGPVWCLGLTKEGEPRHPGRLGYSTARVPFIERAA
jgi:hypothetical protein